MTTDADASRLARQRAQLLLHFAQHLQDEKPPDVRGVLGVVEASDIQLPEHLQLLLCAAWVRRRLQYGILDTGVATLLAGLVPLTEESAQLHVDVRTEACLQLLDAKPVDWGEFDLTVTALFRQPAPPGAQDSGDGGGSGRAAGVGEPQQPQLVAGPGQGLDRKLAQALELLTQEGQREGVLQAVDAAVTVAEECLGVINTAFIKQFQAVTVATLPSPTIQPQQQKAQQQDRDQRGEQSAAEPEPPPPRHDASPLPAAASSLPSRPVLQQQQPRQAAPVQSPDVAFRAEAEALALPDAGTSLGERSVAAAAADLAAVVAATEVGSGSRQAAAVSKETSADASAAGAAEPVAGEERSAPQQRISADSVISLRGAEVHGSGGGDAARAPARALAVCEPPPAAEPPPPNQPSMSLLAWPPQRPSPPRQLLQPPPAPSQPSQPSPPRSPPATVPDPDAMEAERAVLEGGSAQALGDGGGPSQASPAPLELVLPLSGAAEAQLQDEESGAVAPSAVTAAGVPEQARPVADAAANNTKSDVHVATAAPTLVGSDTAMEAIALVPEQPTSVAAKANTAGGAVLANAPPAALLLAPASPQPLTTAAVTLLHYGTTPPTPLLATAAAGEVELRVGDVAAAAEPIADTSALTAAGPEAAAAAAAAVGTEAAEAAGPEAAAAEAAVAEPAVAEPAVAEAAVAEAAVAETAAAEAAAAEAASQPPGPGLLTQQVAPVGAGAAATPGPATDGGGLPPAMHAAATAYQPTSPFAAGTEQAVAAPTPYQPATSPASEAEIMTPPDAGAAAARVDALLGLILPATGPSASGPYQAIGSPHAAGLYTWLGQAQQAVAGSTAQEPDEQQQHQHQHQQPEQHHQVQRSTTPGAGSLAQLLVAVSAGSEATASTRTATAAEVAVEAAVEDTLSPLPLLAQAQSRLAQQQEAEGQEAEGHEAEGNAGVERNAPSEPAEPIVPMEAAAGLQSAAATWGTGSAHGEPFSAAEDSRQPRDQQSADSGGAPLLPGGGGAGEPMAQPKAPLAAAARSEQPHARRDGGSLEDRMLTDAATEAAEVAGSLAAPSAGAAGAAAAAGAGGGRSCSAEPVTPRDPRQLAAGGQGLGGDAHANSAMEANPAQTGASPWGSDVASPPLQPQRTPFPGAVADVPAEAQLEAVPVAMDGASLQALAEAAPGLGSEAVLPAVVRGLALLQLLPTGLEEQVSAAVSAAVSATAAAAQQAAGHAGGVVATAALSSAADAATFCGSAVQPQVEEGVCAKAARSARPQDAVAHMPATDASLQEDCRQGSMDPELDGQPAHPQQAQEGQQRKPDEQQDEQQGHEQQAQKRTPLDALATDSHDGQQQDDSTLTECTARAVRPHAPCSSGSSAQSQGAHQPALQQERSQTQHGAAVSQHASEEDQLLQQDGRQALQAGAHQVTAPTPQEQEPLVQQAGVSALDDESQRGGQPQRTAETAVATGGAAAAEAAVRRIPLDTSTEPGEQLDPVPQRPMPPMPPQPQVFGDVGDAAAALAAGAAVTEVTAVTRAVIFTGAQAGERVASTDAAALLQALEQRPSRPPAAVEDDGRVATQQAGWPQAGSADRSSALGAPAAAPQLPVHQQRSTVLSRVRIQPKSTTGAAPSRLSPDSAPSAQVQAAAPLRPQPVLPAGAAHLGSMRPDGAGLLRTGAVAVPLVAGHPAAPSSAAVADGLQASSQGRQARRIPPSFLANRRSTHSTQQQTGAPGMLATGSGQREPPATAAERQVQGKHGCEQEPGSRSRDQVTAAPASQQPPPAAREAAAQSQLLSAAPAVGRRLVSRGQPDSGAVGTAPQEQPLRAAAEAAAGTPAATQPAVQREASLVVPAAGVKRRRTCLPGGAPPHAAAAAAGARHAPPQESQQQAQQQGTAPSRPRRQQPARVPSSTAQSGLPPFAAVEADDVPYDSAILRQCLDILREPPPDGQDHMPVADIPRWVLDSRCSMLLRRTGDPELVARSAAALLLLHAMINQTPSLPRQQRQLGRQAKGSGSGVGKPAAATAGAEQADCAKIELLQTQRYYVVSPKESEVKLWQEAWEERQRGAQVPAAAAAVPVAAPAAMPPQQPGSTAAGAAQVETIDMTAVPDSPSPARFKSAEGARVCAAIHRAQLQMQSPQRQPPATALHQDLPHERLRTPIPPAAAVTAATPRMQVPAFLAPGVVVSGAASAARTHTDTDIQLPRRRRVRPPSIGPEPGDEEAQRLRLRAEAAAAAENAAKAAAGPAGGSPGGSAARASGSGGGARGAAAAPRSTPSKSPLARLARALAEALPELVELESEPQPAAAAAAGATGAGAATAGAGAHPGQQPEAVAAVDGSSSAEAAGAAENDLRDAALATHAMDASPAAGPQAGAAAGVFQRAGQNGAAAAIRGDGSPGGEAPDSAISVRIDELLHLRALQHRDQVRNLFQSLLGRTPGTPVGPSSQPVPAGAAAISGDPDPGAGAVPAGGAVAAPSLVARAADVPGPVAAAVSNRTPSAAVAASTQQPQPQPEQGPAAQQVSGAGRTRQHQGPQTAAERPTPETVDLNRHLRHVYAGETPFADAVPVQLLERLLRQLDPGRPEPGSPQPPQQQPPPARDTHLPDEQSDAVQLGAGPESAGLDARGRAGGGDGTAGAGGDGADGALPVASQPGAGSRSAAGSGGAAVSQHHHDSLGAAGGGSVGAAATASAGTAAHGGELGEPVAEALQLLLQTLLFAQAERQQQPGQPRRQQQGAEPLDLNLLSSGLQQLLQQAAPAGGAGARTSSAGLPGQAGAGERLGMGQLPEQMAVRTTGAYRGQSQQQPAPADVWPATGQQQQQVHYAYAPPPPQQQPQQPAPMPPAAPRYGAAVPPSGYVHHTAAHQPPPGGQVPQRYAAPHGYDAVQQAYGAPGYAVYSRPGYAAAGSAQYAGYGARAGGHQQYPHGGYAAPHGEAEAMEANQYNDAVGSGGYSSHHTQHGAQQQRQPAVYDTQHGAFMTGYDRMPRTAPGAAAMHQDGRPRMVVTAAVLREQLGGGIRAAVSEVISNASAAGVNARQARAQTRQQRWPPLRQRR
ncbi:hypothetical protein HXX76_007177 [Chlamydomonas incerta]|uniref:Uncharacterized protein n=1 Tax=Chlamydomonas incerta TaxID=51695 RepID=A0A835TA11_CHLIN|nr:hypothetical protein HXX76_007177 [Chlamydomonas incerta]|eukprot:KAG2435090.1 hypothetical protein HXX76_007177 [Chlamydomonas incerta]